jgi:Ca2+-binding RTX toxin-like protein
MAAPTALILNGVVVAGTDPHVTVIESMGAGMRVGVLGALDPEGDRRLTFALVDDAGGRFFIEGRNLRVTEGAVLDAGDASYAVTVRVTDSTGLSLDRLLVIGLTDDAGQAVRSDGTDGDDNQAAEIDGLEIFLASPGADTIVTSDASDIVAFSGRRADYEVIVTPGESGGYGGYGGYGGGTPDRTIVRDLRPGGPDGEDLLIGNFSELRFADGDYRRDEIGNAGATGLLLDGRLLDQDVYLAENVPAVTVIGQLGLRSRPAGTLPVITTFEVLAFHNTPTFIFPDTRNDLFSVDAQGRIVTTGAIDFEQYDSFGLRVFYEDDLGNPAFQAIDVEVDDANDAPVIASAPGGGAPFVLTEHMDTGADVLLGTVTVFDQDTPDGPFTLKLSGADAGRFRLVGDQLFLRAGVVLDFEADPQLDLVVTLRDPTLPASTAHVVPLVFQVAFAERLGTAGIDVILTTAGRDVLRGLAGDDRLNGRAGDDVVDGGEGADTVLGEAGADTLTGGLGADRIIAGAGDDVVAGETLLPVHGLAALRWSVQGPAGTNLLAGFSQAVGALTATIAIADDGALSTATVTTGAQYTAAGEPFAPTSALELLGFGPDTATLTLTLTGAGGVATEAAGLAFRINDIDFVDHRDRVVVTAFDAEGNAVPVTIVAAGNDEVVGGTVTAGLGNDQPSDASGSVLVTVAAPVHSVTLVYTNLLVTDQAVTITDIHLDPGGPLPGDAALNDSLYGNDGNDLVIGGAGDDALFGDAGADTILGGYGRDMMTGGADADVFRFLSAAESTRTLRDIVRDFQAGVDKLDFSALEAAGGAPLFLQAVAGAGYTGAAGEIRVLGVGNFTRVHVDLDGNRVDDLVVDLAGAPVIGAGDLLL